jgi:hypothetical protein
MHRIHRPSFFSIRIIRELETRYVMQPQDRITPTPTAAITCYWASVHSLRSTRGGSVYFIDGRRR